MTRLAFIDTETTGIRPDMGAEIWDLAVIIRDEPGSAASDDEYVWHLRPDLTRADPMALKIGGYYERNRARGLDPGDGKRITQPPSMDDDQFPTPGRALALEVATLLDGAHLMAANPAFDASHLDAWLRRHGQCLAADYHFTDVGSLVRGWAHGSFANPVIPFPLKLDAAAKLARVDPDAYDRHSALGDARLVRDIYDAVTGDAA